MPDKRLLTAASLVRPGSAVCDVGTDHGYLAVYLAEQGITSRITASDVNAAPLDAARRHVESHGVSHLVRTVLSHGLREIAPEDAEDIVICGMGGELIARIVLGVAYTKRPEVRLILQPMTQASYLRKTLSEEGFHLLRELPVMDRGRCYSVMLWAFDGVPRECGRLFQAVGKVPESGLPEAERYLRGQLAKAEKIACGLTSGGDFETAKEWRTLAEELDALRRERYECRP